MSSTKHLEDMDGPKQQGKEEEAVNKENKPKKQKNEEKNTNGKTQKDKNKGGKTNNKDKKATNKDALEPNLEDNVNNSQSQERIIKIRQENDELREQLKVLCGYLSKQLEKKKIGKAGSSTETEDLAKTKQFLEKTIENNEKQKEYYKKKIENLQSKSSSENTPPPQRIDDLLGKLKKADEDIMSAGIKVKELEAVNRILEKEEMNAKNATDFMKNLNLLTVEINALRGKSDKLKRQLGIDEKNFKKQQEFVTKLQIKYTDLCQSLKITPELEKIKEEIEENHQKNLLELQKFNKELQKLRKNSKQDNPQFMIEDLIRLKTEPAPIKKKRYASVKEYKDDKEEIPETFDKKNPANAEKDFQSLRSRIRTMQRIVRNEEKTLQKGLDDYKKQLQDLESENKEIENKLKEKEKELAMANDLLKEMKKNTKFNALTPLNFSMTQTKENNKEDKKHKELEDFTNKSLILRNSDARKRKTKRDSCGAILSYDVVFFDDVQAIGSCKHHHLKSITFFLDKKNCIVGLQATYIKHNEIHHGYKNIMVSSLQNADLSESTFEITDDDYIRNVYGLYVDWIEYLRFETEKGAVFEVGVINEKNNPKEFSLKIRNFDVPVTIFGALDLKKGGNNNEYVLAAIGVEMKNELSERNETRSKEKLEKSQLTKDLLNFSNSSERNTSSSVEHNKKKRYFLKKPDDLIKEEESGKKIKVAKDEKNLSLEKKKPQKSGGKTKINENEASEGEKKQENKGKKNEKTKTKEIEEKGGKTEKAKKDEGKKDEKKKK